jgi:hypothetical protein
MDHPGPGTSPRNTPETAPPNPRSSPTPRPARAARPSPAPVLLSDLLTDLLWPKMLRAPALALRPERWLLATLGLVAIGVVVRAVEATTPGASWIAFATTSIDQRFDSIASLLDEWNSARAADEFANLARLLLVDIPRHSPWVAAACVIPILLIWSIVGGAIARSSAVEFGQGSLLPWTNTVAFALRFWKSLLGSLILAPAAAALIAAALAFAGWLLLSWTGVQVIGGAVYGLFLLGSTLAVLLLAGISLGKHLLLPAVACEGTDALDALQRSLAYVVAGPLRLALYLAIGAFQLIVTTAVAFILVTWIVRFAAWTTGGITRVIGPDAQTGWSPSAAVALIDFWNAAAMLLVGGLALSLYFCTSTITYILVRRCHDGQHAADLWMPGLIRGTRADAPPGSSDQAEDDEW